MLKVNPFESELSKACSWELLGEVRSISDEPIEIRNIIQAKLVDNNREMCLILQYDGQLMAVKVIRHLLTAGQKKLVQVKNYQDAIKNRMTKKSRSRTSHFMDLMNEDPNDDPFADIHKTTRYTFGKKLCSPKELLPKRILLDKRGRSVYFVMRDLVRKLDLIMKAEIVTHKNDSNPDEVDIQIDKVYESFDSRIIYLDFDHLTE